MPDVAYTGADPLQNAFLAAIAKGETGSAGTGATYTGTGGVDLSGASTDAYGFPQWQGTGNSHAAGIYQFQPATWDALASAHGLSFGNAFDQSQAAWYDAQKVYASKTGGDLETDLQAGKFDQIQSALSSEWTSLKSGNLGDLISSGGLPDITGGGGAPSSDTSGGSGGGIVAFLEKEIARFGLLIAGTLIVIVALWYLLSQSTGVPSPTDTAKAAAKGLALAA